VTYTVIVATDNPDGKLLPYMTANVKFETAHRDNVLLVPSSALRWRPKPEQVVLDQREEYLKSTKRHDGTSGRGQSKKKGESADQGGSGKGDEKDSDDTKADSSHDSTSPGSAAPALPSPAASVTAAPSTASPAPASAATASTAPAKQAGSLQSNAAQRDLSRLQGATRDRTHMDPARPDQHRDLTRLEPSAKDQPHRDPAHRRNRQHGEVATGKSVGDKASPRDTSTHRDHPRHERGVVWVDDNGFARSIKVRTGVTDGTKVEIVSGDIKEGMNIIVGEIRHQESDDTKNPFAPTFFRGRSGGKPKEDGKQEK
jgi:hypothetical protein